MSLFKKPKRNFRQRTTKNDSDEENNGDAAAAAAAAATTTTTTTTTTAVSESDAQTNNEFVMTPATAKMMAKTQRKMTTTTTSVGPKGKNVTRTAAALSFEHEDEDEEGEVFKVKKSSYSRRLMKQMEKERKKKKKICMENCKSDSNQNVAISTTMTTTTTMKTATTVDNNKNETARKYDMTKRNVEFVMNGEDVEQMEIESDDDDDDELDDEEKNDPFKRILESGSIPDAAMIHAARKRRQMAREMTEFIPIDSESEKKSSRLVRDDENDRSDEDEDEERGGRISFSVKTPLVKDRAREALLAMDNKDGADGSDDEVDEELERWEQEQIRKGVSIPQALPIGQPATQLFPSYTYQLPSSSTETTTTTSTSSYQSESYSHHQTPSLPQPQQSQSLAPSTLLEPKRERPPPPPLPPPPPPPPILPFSSQSPTSVMTLATYKKHLEERLNSRREVLRARKRERDSIQDDLVSRGGRIQELEEAAPQVARTFEFYQEMRGYVTDLVECLDEKMGKINQLESSLFHLLKQHALHLVQRSQQDVKDQSEEFMTLIGKASVVDNREKPVDAAKARRTAEREGRRTRRRRAREARGTNVGHFDGMSSDDEEIEADIVQFNSEKDRILEDASHVFDDVLEDYHSFSKIKKRFEKWNETHPESYKNAYIALCIPKVFSTFVRLQLLSWNPIEDIYDFEESSWFESLMFYGYREGVSADNLKDDSNSMVIPSVIERVILPKLSEVAEHLWNPMSTSQTLRFVNLMRKLINEYPTVNGKSKKTLALFEAIVKRMRKCLDEDVYMPPYPKAILENKSLRANAFYQRQFWTCVKLLRNLLSWQGIINDEILQEVALDGLLTRYILWALHNSPLNKETLVKAKLITATIPRSWFVKRNSDSTIPQLEMFCRYLKCAADTMDKMTANASIADKMETKENIREIIQMLTNIGALNHASHLSNQFSITDIRIQS